LNGNFNRKLSHHFPKRQHVAANRAKQHFQHSWPLFLLKTPCNTMAELSAEQVVEIREALELPLDEGETW
jgi:hypothetical protein